MMSEAQVKALARRISDQGNDVDVRDFLGALGMVVCQGLNQLPPEERMAGTVSWISVLSQSMLQEWKRLRAN